MALNMKQYKTVEPFNAINRIFASGQSGIFFIIEDFSIGGINGSS